MASTRKWTYGVLALVGAAAVAVIISIGFFLHFGRLLDKSSKSYVDDSIIAISENWDKEIFLSRTSESFKQNLKDSEVSDIFSRLSAFGKLEKYEGSHGEAHIAIIIGKEETITAKYEATANYSAGILNFTVGLVFINGKWKIQSFDIQRK
jgi:hypothetical protein